MSYMLKLKTYLSPDIPRELYQHIINYLDHKLNITIELITETQNIGPDRTKKDPFSLNQVDIGHFHTQPYLWLSQKTPSPIELLPIGPIFNDPRIQNKPVYFVDVISKDSLVNQFANIKSSMWATCNPQIQNILTQNTNTHAIDSHILALHNKQSKIKTHAPDVKILESWGPYPMQPLVIRKGFDTYLKTDIINALKEMHQDHQYGPKLENYLIKSFGDLSNQDFEESRNLLKIYENLSF
ncbi:MAG: hypothetical protein ABH827_03230 [bacterium]